MGPRPVSLYLHPRLLQHDPHTHRQIVTVLSRERLVSLDRLLNVGVLTRTVISERIGSIVAVLIFPLLPPLLHRGLRDVALDLAHH